MEAQYVDLCSISQEFPRKLECEIARDNILDTMDQVLSGTTELLVLEGVEDIGKTTTASQFARRHGDHCVSVFVRKVSRWGIDPSRVMFDICNQMEWILRQQELDGYEATEAILWRQIQEISRTARIRKETFYFIVDGLLDG